MTMILPFKPILRIICLLAGFLPLAGLADNDARFRLICVTALAEDSKVVLATRNKDGQWQQHGRISLRSSLVSDWIPAGKGEIHILSNDGGGLKSIGSFTFPEKTSSALVALNADTEAGTYQTRAVNARTEGFAKGSTLILNLSEESATVALGSTEAKVEAGKDHVATPSGDEEGSFRLTVSRDIDGQPTLCYDRQRVANPNSRNLLVLIPDEHTGIRVEGLPLFGEMD